MLVLLAIAKYNIKPDASLNVFDQIQRAQCDRQPVVIFFYSQDCVPCEQMAEVLRQTEELYTTKLAFIKVDATAPSNQPLVWGYRVSVTPTIVLLDAKGESRRIIGVLSPEQFVVQLNDLISSAP